MDGNGRWAKRRNLPRTMGHRAGAENLRGIIESTVEFGVKILTIYAFSTENWKRPKTEVKGLMSLLHYYFNRELDELLKNGVRVRHLGKMDGIAPRTQKEIRQAVEKTAHNDRLILNVAFNYGGRAEILDAIRQIVAAKIPPEEITEETVNRFLYTAGQPDPDLIIRTSGEFRTSNFLTWQAAYSEYYITPILWPDFNKQAYYQALKDFSQRKRRSGGLADEEETGSFSVEQKKTAPKARFFCWNEFRVFLKYKRKPKHHQYHKYRQKEHRAHIIIHIRIIFHKIYRHLRRR